MIMCPVPCIQPRKATFVIIPIIIKILKFEMKLLYSDALK